MNGNMNKEVTTLIVGSGPAGVMAAYYAAARGPVLMVDTFTLPRDKSCGGMIHPLSQAVLSEIVPVPDALLLDPPQVYFRYNDWDRQLIKNTDLYFLNIDRMPFDEWLLSLLPDTVEVRDATSFVGYEVQGDGCLKARLRGHDKNEYTVTCDYLVGADGPRSTVRKCAGLPAFDRYITVQDYCKREGAIDPVFDCFHFGGISEFAIGYIIPKDERVLVGLVYYPGTKKAHELQDKALAKLRERLPIGDSLKREAWIAPKHQSARSVSPGIVAGSGERGNGKGAVLLAGEAGGYISPTSGEGISWALATGKSAGQAIAAGTDAADILAAHSRACKPLQRDIARRLRWYPFMITRWGKTLANYVPERIVSHFTHYL